MHDIQPRSPKPKKTERVKMADYKKGKAKASESGSADSGEGTDLNLRP